MKGSRIFLAAVMLMLGSAVQAADTPPKTGTQTRALLQVQQSGSAVAKTPVKPVPGEVADRVYQRYLNSFSQPIPASFPTASLGNSSGSGK